MDRKIIWINKWINVDNVATSSVCDSLIYMQIYVLSSTLTQKYGRICVNEYRKEDE